VHRAQIDNADLQLHQAFAPDRTGCSRQNVARRQPDIERERTAGPTENQQKREQSHQRIARMENGRIAVMKGNQRHKHQRAAQPRAAPQRQANRRQKVQRQQHRRRMI